VFVMCALGQMAVSGTNFFKKGGALCAWVKWWNWIAN